MGTTTYLGGYVEARGEVKRLQYKHKKNILANKRGDLQMLRVYAILFVVKISCINYGWNQPMFLISTDCTFV